MSNTIPDPGRLGSRIPGFSPTLNTGKDKMTGKKEKEKNAQNKMYTYVN
jgi:hypothetical protein